MFNSREEVWFETVDRKSRADRLGSLPEVPNKAIKYEALLLYFTTHGDGMFCKLLKSQIRRRL